MDLSNDLHALYRLASGQARQCAAPLSEHHMQGRIPPLPRHHSAARTIRKSIEMVCVQLLRRTAGANEADFILPSSPPKSGWRAPIRLQARTKMGSILARRIRLQKVSHTVSQGSRLCFPPTCRDQTPRPENETMLIMQGTIYRVPPAFPSTWQSSRNECPGGSKKSLKLSKKKKPTSLFFALVQRDQAAARKFSAAPPHANATTWTNLFWIRSTTNFQRHVSRSIIHLLSR